MRALRVSLPGCAEANQIGLVISFCFKKLKASNKERNSYENYWMF
jgi:hypothetical protein